MSNGAEVDDADDLMPNDKLFVSDGEAYKKKEEGLISSGLSALSFGASWAYGAASTFAKEKIMDEQTRKQFEEAEAKAADTLAPLVQTVKEAATPAVAWTDKKLNVATEVIAEKKKQFDESEQGRYLNSTIQQAKEASISTGAAIKATIEEKINALQPKPSTMNVSVQHIAEKDGKRISIYTLHNELGMQVSICNLGAAITSCRVTDGLGQMSDVVLASESPADLLKNSHYLGAMIGRQCARTSGSSFTLGGTTYQLTKNDNEVNHLHGGNTGLHHALWEVKAGKGVKGPFVHLERKSPDGEDGYPGEMTITTRYTLLSTRNCIELVVTAVGSKDCPVNFTNHSYFNLNGHVASDITNHTVQINGSKYVDVDSQLIATGKLLDAKNTLFDFRAATNLGQRLQDKDIKENKATNGGYDHTFLIDKELAKTKGEDLLLAAEVTTGAKGRLLRVYTDMPAVHLYTGNFLDNTNGKAGAKYAKYQGLMAGYPLRYVEVRVFGLKSSPVRAIQSSILALCLFVSILISLI
eukprot:CAMPEP_0170198634 /NCGR_PEP_ID=MMETSP0040_2-20121228/68883_1 /TAXON_ID=641309 /ORGANISM="Lotharella oceanica, Strain CCMP622" /LENGTH=524 /DNA_ID=CAMNT_0010448655 /DNA_START=39 /DNA_END=1613 /DNA_ORIENTATION=-